jgi:hypothetical protein
MQLTEGKIAFYDHREKAWTTCIKERRGKGLFVDHDRHVSEQAARQHIGVAGGSPDPEFIPTSGDTRLARA